MDFTQEATPQGLTVALSGAFTFKDHHSFRAVLDLLKANRGGRHVLDLGGLEFLDSAALGMLLVAEDETSTAGSKLTLRNLPPRVTRLFELAAMDSLFTIER